MRRTHDEGHTLANHSQSHPFNFHRMSVEDAAREIEGGFQSIAAAVGDPAKVAPFFRFPGLLRQDSVEHYLRSKRVMAWSVDFMADDWTRINAHEIVRRALERLEAKGKGILLLHDIKPATALGLPELLRELKARGYRVVHVVPSAAGRPATVTTAEQWLVRQPPSREQVAQARAERVAARRCRIACAPRRRTMQAPSVTSFGAETHDDAVPVTLVSAPETLRAGDGEVALPPWPEEVITIAAFPELDVLPAPARGPFPLQPRSSAAAPPRRTSAGPTARSPTRPMRISPGRSPSRGSGDRQPKAKSSKTGKSANPSPKNAAKPRNGNRPGANDPIGHQIRITQPQASLAPPSR